MFVLNVTQISYDVDDDDDGRTRSSLIYLPRTGTKKRTSYCWVTLNI